MVVLGIDPGLANTGWGIVEMRQGICRCRAYGCISTQAHTPLHERLGVLCADIFAVIERYNPGDMAIEKIFFGQNTKSAIATAHARGAVLVAGAQKDLHIGEYTPLQIKQAIVGNGHADKDQVIYMVRNVLKLDHDPKPDHAADALACAIFHANMKRTYQMTNVR